MKLFRDWTATLEPPFERDELSIHKSSYCSMRRWSPSSGLWHFLALAFRPQGCGIGEQCWLEIGIGPVNTIPWDGQSLIWQPDEMPKGNALHLRPHGLWSESRCHCGWIILVEEKPLTFPDHVGPEERQQTLAMFEAMKPVPDECFPPADREGLFATPEAAMDHLRWRITEWVLPYMREKETDLYLL